MQKRPISEIPFLEELTLQKILKKEELGTLMLQWKKSPNNDTRDKILASNMRTILNVAYAVTGANSSTVEEYIAPGLEGLLDALRSFEPERGLSFNTLAKPRVRGAILDYMRETKLMRGPRGNTATRHILRHACPLEEVLGVVLDYQGVEDVTTKVVETIEQNQRVLSALNLLSEGEYRIIRMRFWEDLTRKEIAENIGLEPRIVRQLETSAMKVLRANLSDMSA